ncbi:HSP20-like chaperone [Xylariaceae sp. FL0662B]|nr:HSP20-like chaperone [Xylariaceae sp. FL0662B]
MENNNQNQAQGPFWEFVNSFGPGGSRAGFGVDHSNFGPQPHAGFPFDPAQFNHWFGQGWGPAAWGGPWAGRGGPGRHGYHHQRGGHEPSGDENGDDHDMESSPETLRETMDTPNTDAPPPPPPPPGAFPHPPPPPGMNPPPYPQHHRGHPHPFGHHRGCGGRFGRGGRHGMPPPPVYNGPFDFQPLIQAFSSHPFAQAFRQCMEQARAAPSQEPNEQQEDSFAPPVDVFNTETAYVLHVSLPGAAKEDISVSWDGENIKIAGVVYRPGNEEFLQSLVSSERKVGLFEKSIKLPPVGSDEKDDVEGLSITAKMENGILIVTVPKTEKEWTKIHHVDIE